MRDMAIKHIMTTEPATVGPDEPIAVAQKLLGSGDIHHLPVVDNGRLAGIVSSSDLLKFHLLDGGPDSASTATVRQIMEADPVALESEASLSDAAIRLSVGGYHALPVVDADGTLVGIVTTGDLVGHLLEQIPRGDGSLPETSDSEKDLSANQIALALRGRNQSLERVCQAAEQYLRSGQGEHEHSVLVKRLAELQESHTTDL